ncbi:MAG TPA: oligosaccharide flippase family protein [Gemmatimonadales bacterium]|nr:oligosaccharide flippase family protein [Gemmatimonadales bacterium]
MTPSLRLLQKSTALRAAVGFGLGGVGFALGNLLLARALPPAEFGVFTLFLALVQMGASLGPIGLQGQVNRHPNRAVSFPRLLLTSAIVGGALAAIAWAFYGLEAALVAALFASIVAGGCTLVASSVFQSRLRFAAALGLSQSFALVLLAMGAAAVVIGHAPLWLLGTFVAGQYVLLAIVGWGILGSGRPAASGEGHSLWEGLSLLGITAAALLLMQLERLLAPRLLSLEDLARFAVVATLVGSPFRMLQMGAGYTLLPRLRAASSPQARWRLVRHEALAVALIGGAGGVVLLSAAPWIAEHLLAGKYQLSTGLMIAALVSGVAKLADAIATTMVWALASPRQLAMLNWVSWTCAAIGVALGWLGARWGLLGLMYGVTAAWVCRGAVSGALAASLLGREQASASMEPGAAAGVVT